MKFEMSWVEGISALVVRGLIATRQFLNTALSANERLYIKINPNEH